MRSHQYRHMIEKFQVQAAAVLALAGGALLLWPALRPWDPQGALAFGGQGPGKFLLFLALAWATAGFCAILTIGARPEGALLASLVGLAGLSLRSGPTRDLLWQWHGQMGTLYLRLSAEAALMALALLGMMAVIAAVRGAMRRLAPAWSWQEPAPPAAENPQPKVSGWLGVLRDFGRNLAQGHENPMLFLGAAAVELAVAILLIVVTFRSAQVGQIAFALAGSFFVAALLAHQAFPARAAWPFWAPPLLLAVIVLASGAGVAEGASGAGPDWFNAMRVAHDLPVRAALPVHWLALGVGGAVGGLWVSRRIHEGKTQS